jgi:Fe-S-cluster containining protein
METPQNDSILDKYWLADLETKPVGQWTEADRQNVLSACKKENMAPQLPILFNPGNIELLLKKSYCRGCGSCCGWGQNAVPADAHGLFLFESELKRISQRSRIISKQIESKATRHESDANAWYLPFPCIFRPKHRCKVYEVRPFACRTFPLLNYVLDGKYYIAVNVQCDYGSDIYLAALREIGNNLPSDSLSDDLK